MPKVFIVLFLCFSIGAAPLMAQKKKSIRVSELDQINGLYYQPNTVGPYTGTAFEDFPNGKKKLRVPIREGKVHGKAIEWAKNGKKVHESTFENGLQTGMEYHWYATGKKKLQVAYSNGKPNGLCTEWHKNEAKKSEGQFVNGLEEGAHNWWYADGQKDQIIPYRNGKTEGTVQQWHPNGQLRLETQFKGGFKDGTMTEWYDNGQKKQSGRFAANQKDGKFMDWSKKGRLLGEQLYQAGELKEDRNYRNGSIRSQNGYIQVFNELESFFRLNIEGAEEVAPIQSRELTFSVDGIFLEVFIRPVSSLPSEGSAAPTNTKALLEQFVQQESQFIRQETQFELDVQSQYVENAEGALPYVHWHFVSPSSKEEEQKARTVQHEHYISVLCHKQILNLYSVVTNSDDPAAVPAMLKRIAATVDLQEARIDLNEIVRQLR
ncbi:MAG: toxin-antitoxin system YwqK family antitoxin [Bacteroidota bacterium]